MAGKNSYGTTSKVIDEIVRFGATAGAITAAFVAPNILRSLKQELNVLYKHLDARERERELRRVIYYMKSQGLLVGRYEHGLQLTAKAKRRLAKIELARLTLHEPAEWDGLWRIVIYDIPEKHRQARRNLTSELRRLGCFQLQKSAWITPFACRDSIAAICAWYNIDTFVTYFEAINLDNERVLLDRFRKKYPHTGFVRQDRPPQHHSTALSSRDTAR